MIGHAMPARVDDQEISRARHDLRTVVNHLEGYVLLLREDEEPWVRALDTSETLDRIDEASHEILQLLDRSRTRRRDLSPAHVLAQIQAGLESPAITVETALIKMLRNEDAAQHSDVRRLQQAAARLRQFIEKGEVSSEGRPSQRAHTPSPTANPLVLVVEDDEGNRELLDRMLTRFAYDVAGAATGTEALRMLASTPFDVVLLDLMLPDIEGFALLQRIRQQFPMLPIIVISALHDVDSIVRCIDAGAEDYFAKPFIPVLLRTRVASAIDRKRYRELLAQATAKRPADAPILR